MADPWERAAVLSAAKLAAEAGVTLQAECADLAVWNWGPPRFEVVVAIFIQFAPPPLRDQPVVRPQHSISWRFKPDRLSFGGKPPLLPQAVEA
jgi:hypothetical protein